MNNTLAKGLQILERLAAEAREFAVTELAADLDLPKSAVHRLLTTLVERGYVRRNPQTARYAVALKVVEVSCETLANLPLRAQAGPYAHSLAERLNGTAYLGVPHEGRVLLVMVSYARGIMRPDDAAVGRTMPLHLSAIGRALIACRSDLAESCLSTDELPALTDRSITDPPRLRELLADIRQDGVAESLGEHGANVAGVASPIFNAEGNAVAGIGLALPLPDYESNPARAQEVRNAVREAAVSASFALGYTQAHQMWRGVPAS
jgi:DNA-binding IclR family transcriptional regulator